MAESRAERAVGVATQQLRAQLESSRAQHAAQLSAIARGQRVFHQKFGYGHVRVIEGNKLLVDFEKAGEKRVIDSFVEKAD